MIKCLIKYGNTYTRKAGRHAHIHYKGPIDATLLISIQGLREEAVNRYLPVKLASIELLVISNITVGCLSRLTGECWLSQKSYFGV